MAAQLPLSSYAQIVSASTDAKLASPLGSWLVHGPSGFFFQQSFFRATETWRSPTPSSLVDPSGGGLTLASSGVYVDSSGNFYDASGARVNPYLARSIFNQYALPVDLVVSDYKDEMVLLLFALVQNYRSQWDQDQAKAPDDFRVVLFQKLMDLMSPYMKRIYSQYRLPLVGKTADYGMSKPKVVWAVGYPLNGTFDPSRRLVYFMTKAFADDYATRTPGTIVVGLQPVMPSRCGAFSTLAGLA